MSKITMTPQLQTALVKLRDANVALRVARDAQVSPIHGGNLYSTRSKIGKALEQRGFAAWRVRDNALDDLLAVIDPGHEDA